MDALLTLIIYLAPFLIIGIVVTRWMARSVLAWQTFAQRATLTEGGHGSCWASGVRMSPNERDRDSDAEAD